MALPIADVYFSSAANTFVGPPNPERTFVGAYPYLDTADADGSYAQVWELDDAYGHAVVRFAPAAVTVQSAVTVRVQLWCDHEEYFAVHLFGADDGYAWWANVLYDTPNEWVTWTLSTDSPDNLFYPALDAAGIAAAAAAGELRVSLGNGDHWRVSLIEVDLGGPRPLRWRQRADGLGGGSPAAARGVRTQQGSIRHRGIL